MKPAHVRNRAKLVIGGVIILCALVWMSYPIMTRTRPTIREKQKAMERQKLKDELSGILEHTDEKLSQLEAKIAEASETRKEQISMATSQIEIEKNEVVARLEEVEDASGDDWESMQSQTEQFIRTKTVKIDSLIQTVKDQLKRN